MVTSLVLYSYLYNWRALVVDRRDNLGSPPNVNKIISVPRQHWDGKERTSGLPLTNHRYSIDLNPA